MIFYRRNHICGASYFFTVNLADRRSKLLTDNIRELRAAFREVRQRHPFALDAVVVLPDHLHAIWTLPDGDNDYIHFNPVKHGLVERVSDWPHSSFAKMVHEGIYPEDWAGDNQAPGNSFGERDDVG